jgi:hypothetical protein
MFYVLLSAKDPKQMFLKVRMGLLIHTEPRSEAAYFYGEGESAVAGLRMVLKFCSHNNIFGSFLPK